MPPQEHLEYVVRRAEPDDYPGILHLLEDSGMRSPDRDGPLLSLDYHGRWVAQTGDEIIGHIHRGDRFGFSIISGMVVMEKYRGLGIGRAIMNAVLHDLRRQGRQTVELLVDDDTDQRVVDWYQSLGFEPKYRATGYMMQLAEVPMVSFSHAEAFRRVDNLCSSTNVSVYEDLSLNRLSSAMTQAPHPTISWAGEKISRGKFDEGIKGTSTMDGVISMSPWFEAASGVGMPGEKQFVRWGNITMKHANGHLLRVVRASGANLPPANPRGQVLEPEGDYLLYHEHTSEVLAFRLEPGADEVTELTGEDLAPLLQDLRYVARTY